MIELLAFSDGFISNVKCDFSRYLLADVDWSLRLIGIKGSRGTGKTTMLLQWLKSKGLARNEAAYFSLDNLYFTTHSLVDTAVEFHQQGGQILVLDEVHKYEGWSREVKNIYDAYPNLQVVFTGSSIIDISNQEADLSRRAVMYELYGLSYREFLELKYGLKIEKISLEQLINDKNGIRQFFPSDFKPLAYFKEYLTSGYYPFFMESAYQQRLQQLVRSIVEYDMAELRGFDIRNAKKMLQLLYVIAQNVPFKPNITSLAEKSKIHRNSLNNYLHYLEQARLIALMYPSGKHLATLQKPEKIYLDNTNLLYALSNNIPEKGTVREVFFHSQLKVKHAVAQAQKGDFKIDNSFTYEVGGIGKTLKQIADVDNAWLVKDDLEYGVGKALPLWAFGFLY